MIEKLPERFQFLSIIPVFHYFMIPVFLILRVPIKAVKGEGGGEGGGACSWLRLCRAVCICVPLGVLLLMLGPACRPASGYRSISPLDPPRNQGNEDEEHCGDGEVQNRFL